jgi:hypothetical protein
MYRTEYRVYVKLIGESDERIYARCDTREEAEKQKAYYEADDDKEYVQIVEVKL